MFAYLVSGKRETHIIQNIRYLNVEQALTIQPHPPTKYTGTYFIDRTHIQVEGTR